jgi:ABC-type dipeptide/oligopeptide/nickel transport system permease subunit
MKANSISSKRFEIFTYLMSKPLNCLGVTVVALLLFIAVFAPLITPYDPYEINPINRLSGITSSHPFGTDNLGRDVLSRMFFGTRTALMVGLLGVTVSLLLGLVLGITAAYFGSLIESFILLAFDVLRSFPTIILILVIISVVGPSLINIILALSITFMPTYGRAARARTLSVKEEDYIKAAEALGATGSRIVRVHILKNVVGPLIIMGGMDVGYMITLEAGLAFLGLGVPQPMASWGNMLRLGFEFMLKNPLMLIWPSIALFVAVAGFSLVAETLRNYLDPSIRRS